MAEAPVKRILFYRLRGGEDLLEAIKRRAEEGGVESGVFMAIGALRRASFGYFMGSRREYKKIALDRQVELLSCVGDISKREDGETVVHAHIIVGDEDGRAYGGHLMEGSIIAEMVELAILDAPNLKLKRTLDPRTGLYLLKL